MKSLLHLTLLGSFMIAAPAFLNGPALAQKLVDPASVAPEYREAAEKRRAEQISQRQCIQKADEARVVRRDRTAYITKCLDEAGPNPASVARQ